MAEGEKGRVMERKTKTDRNEKKKPPAGLIWFFPPVIYCVLMSRGRRGNPEHTF